MDIFLIAPNGSQIELSTDNGGNGNNYTATFQTAGAALPTGDSTINGTFAPEQAFSVLTGAATGTWTLRVVDDAADDFGTINSWGITFDSRTCPLTYSWTSTPSGFTSSIQNPTGVFPIVATTYAVTATNIYGCTASTTTASVAVNSRPTASVISGSAAICSGSPTNIAVAITGGTSPFTVVYTGGTASSYISGTNISVAPTSTTTYTITSVTDANGCVGTGNSGSAVVTIDTTTSTDGGATWSNGTPTASKSVIFDGGTGTIGANFAGCSLRLTNNASVTVASGFNVTLEGRVTVDAGSTFTFNNNSNLLQNNTLTNSGNIVVQRNSSALKRLDYTLWSSPVTGQGLYAFSPLTFSTRFYQYLTATNVYSNSLGFAITGLDANGVNGTDSNNVQFATAKGYLIRMPWNHPTAPAVWNGQFTGIPNNGNLTFAMTTGFNAVGNPYPSRINVHNFIDDNAAISGTLYFWRKTNDNAATSYATLTKTAYVANGAAGGDTGTGFFPTGGSQEQNWVINVGQGFIVEATSSTNLSFTNSMRRSSNADQFFRNADTIESVNNGLYWLNLTDATGVFSQMAVGYSSEGTLGFDRGIDGANINNEFYLTSLIGTEEYAIQGRPDFDASDIVPLSYKAVTAGNYTISIDHTAGGFSAGTQPIYLKDNLTTTVHDLTASNYTFTSQAGTFNNRFEVVYQSALNTDNPTFNANQVIVYKNEVNDFVINSGNVVMASVKVFDIRGRLLLERKDINASQTTLTVGMANEVLLVQITSEDGVVVTKKVVR
ncbi:T9SS sorting signal type C domain-containing protein [Flavobacterium sp. j3]|uniref:T9SS sorting signal type C domain-containing protein n=1 Tax=Flavobacterium aureirubrum TaxID=3133147 RepID=A0ABU9N0B0_9FLAO